MGPQLFSIFSSGWAVAYPEYARGWGVSHILPEKRGVSLTLLKKMHENSIFSPIIRSISIRRVRPMLDPPLGWGSI